MTCREKLEIEHPEKVSNVYFGRCEGCPGDYGYIKNRTVYTCGNPNEQKCTKCWDQEIPGTEKPDPTFTDLTNELVDCKKILCGNGHFTEDQAFELIRLMLIYAGGGDED